MARACSLIANSPRFQNFIYGVIVANAVTLGLGTYDWSDSVNDAITVADEVFLGIFVLELAIRIAAYGRRPQDFFKSGWNVFDFVVIGAVFLPGVRENVTLLRLVRLLRVVRLISVMPDLRILVRAMARSLPPIASLGLLTLLLMYVYGMVGWILFHERGSRAVGKHRPGPAEPVPDPHARELAGLPRGRAGDPPVVVDLLRLLRPDRLVPGHQRPDRDHHQLDGGGPRGREAGRSAELEDDLAEQQGVTVAERMREIREAIDTLETAARRGRRRSPGPGALGAQAPDQGRAHARLVGLSSGARRRTAAVG